MFRFFRHIAIFEGFTTLALFLVAMPLKYLFDTPGLVPPVGMIHGWAFVAYIATMIVALWDKGFTPVEWMRTTSFVPFGTFLNDPFLRRKQSEMEASRC